jgi:hypothetical protein
MFQTSLKWICIVITAAFLSCTTSEMKRKSPDVIDKYLLDHPDLPVTDRTCIEDGRFEIGILKETLIFLLGEPKEKVTIKQPWAVQEQWKYGRSGKKVFILEGNYVVGILEN